MAIKYPHLHDRFMDIQIKPCMTCVLCDVLIILVKVYFMPHWVQIERNVL